MRFGWVATYIITASLGLMMAILVSSSLMSRSQAQTPSSTMPPPPTNDPLPPEVAAAAGSTAEAAPPPPTTAPVTTPPPAPTSAAATMPPAPAPTTVPSQGMAALPATGLSLPAAGAAPTAGTSVGGEEYVYEANGRRDPFRRYKSVHTEGREMTPADLDPLLRYDLDQLTLIGIMWDVRQPRALVRDSDGGVHTLVKNTKLGHNNGFVATIREGQVVVVETFEEEGGGATKRSRILDLKK